MKQRVVGERYWTLCKAAATSPPAAKSRKHLPLPVFAVDGLLAHAQAQGDGFPGEAGLPGFPDQGRFRAPDFLLQLGDRLQGFSRSLPVHGCNQGLHLLHLHASTLVDAWNSGQHVLTTCGEPTPSRESKCARTRERMITSTVCKGTSCAGKVSHEKLEERMLN